MTHWVNEYIGKPWERGCAGPDRFDCFGLVQFVGNAHFDLGIPDLAAHPESLKQAIRAIRDDGNWAEFVPVDRPQSGDLVKMYRHSDPDHIGIWVDADGGGVLHSSRGIGVMFDTPFLLASMGWVKLEYYRRKRIGETK
jgi:cell wall-associated NlpC family hydrolase